MTWADRKVAVVTGGARGIGLAIGQWFLANGHQVVLLDVDSTTLDATLARTLEPRAAAPHRRLRTIRTLVDAGIPVGVSVSPQIPFVNEDMEQVLAAAREAVARMGSFSYDSATGVLTWSRQAFATIGLPWAPQPHPLPGALRPSPPPSPTPANSSSTTPPTPPTFCAACWI